ncbi:MAG: cysteine desulfurase family protein [Flavobacteriales bacterium AspAUS03]
MDRIYLDNAATTPIRDEVVEVMMSALKKSIGNPSSPHQFGREVRALIEESRISVARRLNALPSEIIFTSGGTEANNLILRSAVRDLKIRHIVTSPLEHKAVLETVLDLSHRMRVMVELVRLKEKGVIDLEDLDQKLQNTSLPTLVTLMYANNEIGNLLDVENIEVICKKYSVYFHSDTVQAVGHYPLNMIQLPFHFASASAHKFHGPAGVGFAFIRKAMGLRSILTGGYQERSMRAGTENTSGIIGLAKALDLACLHLEEDKKRIEALKSYCISSLKQALPYVVFNGLSDNMAQSIYTVLNISLPIKDDLLGFELDLKGIAVSQGSACNSGSGKSSYVIDAVSNPEQVENTTSLRISFGIFNQKKDIDALVLTLKDLMTQKGF